MVRVIPFLVALFLFGCFQGPTGPAGPTGKQGVPGVGRSYVWNGVVSSSMYEKTNLILDCVVNYDSAICQVSFSPDKNKTPYRSVEYMNQQLKNSGYSYQIGLPEWVSNGCVIADSSRLLMDFYYKIVVVGP